MIEFIEKTFGRMVHEYHSTKIKTLFESSWNGRDHVTKYGIVKEVDIDYTILSDGFKRVIIPTGDFIICHPTTLKVIKRKDFVDGLFSGIFAIKQ